MFSARSIKALSVSQPWAYLIVTGQKTVELRPWTTDYRGPVVIQASQQLDPAASAYFGLGEVELPHGEAIGVVDVVGVFSGSRADMLQHRWEHRMWGPYLFGQCGLVFSNPAVFRTPVRLSGQQRLFDLPLEHAPSILEQLRLVGNRTDTVLRND